MLELINLIVCFIGFSLFITPRLFYNHLTNFINQLVLLKDQEFKLKYLNQFDTIGLSVYSFIGICFILAIVNTFFIKYF